MSGASIISVGLNFLSSIVIANYFGAGAATDSLIVGLTLAMTIAPPLISSFDAAFLPVYNRLPSNIRIDFTRQVVVWVAVALTALAGAVWLLRFAWLPLFLRGVADSETYELVALGSVGLVLLGVGLTVQRSILTAEADFEWVALATILVPAATVTAILLFHQKLGPVSAFIGLLSGSAISLIVSWSAGRLGTALPRPSTRELRELGPMVVRHLPVAIGALLFAAASLVLRAAASLTGVGGISAQYYAERVFMVPHTLIAVSAASVLLPFLIKWQAADSAVMNKIVTYSVLLMGPVTVLLVVFAGDIIRISFQHGDFTPKAAAATAAALRGYSLGLIPLFITTLAWRVLQLRASRAKVLLMPTLYLAVTALSSVGLVQVLGLLGIGLASSLGAVATSATAIVWLRPWRPAQLSWSHSLRILALAGIAMAVVGLAVARALDDVSVLLRLSAGIAICALAYVVVLRAFRIAEIGEIRSALQALR